MFSSEHFKYNTENQTGSGMSNNEDLPSWDLSDLYPSPDSPELKNDLEKAREKVEAFAANWKGNLKDASGQELAMAIDLYQEISEILGRVGSYAQLMFATDSTDAKVAQFYQYINEQITNISSGTLFFTLELNRISEEELQAKLSNEALLSWKPFLDSIRVFKPYQLNDEIEKVLHEKSVTGRTAWSRLYDETLASMQVTVQDEKVTLGEALNKLSSADRQMRENSAKGLGESFNGNIRLFSLITNTLAKDKHITDEWRKFPRVDSERNCDNMIEDDVVDALVNAVTQDYQRLSHRYFTLKAKWLGLDKLQHWDRNAPLPDDTDQTIPWEQAKEIVHTAYNEFNPDMGSMIKQFLDQPWIDAALRPGKSSGAFAHPTVPDVHPYILLNYHGRNRDVMTLAHELGHGIHQILAAKQGYIQSNTPLTLAETASVFGEMLTFQSLLRSQKTPEQRRIMLSRKVEDMLNTVVRQIAFYQFERKVHEARQTNELLPDEIGNFWMETQQASLGPAFEFTPEYKSYWTYIPHFIHSPFYVYAYAFGDCLVNALYKVYQDGHENFQEKYIEMLQAGGTKKHKELLAPFGLDASDPAFWRKGLDVISQFIDELEQA
ncbi:Oligoendopeptidase F (PepF) (PDB:3CE2) [Commensalibacter papalotli (ex Botero et al. 2024)]|uniref:Oligoendopeptidase F (PepF) (PDB:3CE2) n=2 Tax=Commensalibacter papalotli (ex Botero et al. 2024) TaxID=2972766 RepID=A0ABN8WAF1_9PROT|nr:Oligoendopeptidase F (PepF) (PDB:3CE2) [Commensalibacter papalotli (ex Botero et al. 2024)]CAI3928795.1 Oligoendopeptidase F (PepF) (PDB:3CE2) [Commensalibacter papalotli (ex Botero et al. 2024)]